MAGISDLVRKSIQLVPWKFRRHIKDLPLVGPAQRLLVHRLAGRGDFLHTIDAGPARGLRMRIRLPDDKQVWTGTYEAVFATAVATAIRKADVCFDIGGYHGFFSGVCALAGAESVHIFEPLPANVARIRGVIEANPTLRLIVHDVAIGADVGETEFVVMPEASMGKLSSSSFQQQQRGAETIRVPAETLDHLVETGTVPHPDVIKIDVEGAEAMVLAGGERILRLRRPKLFIEVHSRQLGRACAGLVTRYGYTVTVLETSRPPDFETEPDVCHFAANAS